MNFVLHKHKVSKFVKDVPIGLSELMSDISREVLRAQPSPENMYEFIGDYIESLIAARERTTIVRHIIDDILDMNYRIAEDLNQRGISYEKANKAATIIQKCFRTYMSKREIHKTEFNESSAFKELVEKCSFTYKEILQSGPTIRNAFKQFVQEYTRILKGALFSEEVFDWDVHNAFEIYANSTSSDETDETTKTHPDTISDRRTKSLTTLSVYNGAACTIQKSYRNYRKRKIVSDILKEVRKESKAATTIQTMFRAYIARKRFSSGELFGVSASSSMKEPIIVSESELSKAEVVNTEIQTAAATIIQSYLRRYLVQKRFIDELVIV